MKSIIPGEYRQYEWIANTFKKVKGVEIVAMNVTEDGINMFMSNNKTGKQKKVFEFPLRRMFFVDYHMAPDCRHDYDIMDLEDPQAMVKLGEAKAYMFFNDIKVN